MRVVLVSQTKPAEITTEELLVSIARVSSTREDKTENPAKLINYLIRNKHWSPFEMASMCVEITTSRAIAQQILRHRSFSFQEFSQRYAEVLDEQVEPVQLRKQAVSNRQSSAEEIHNAELAKLIRNHCNVSVALYKRLLNEGVAKECARMVLPMTVQTRLFMHGTLRSWIHYLDIRCDIHTQQEHREIAEEIKDLFVDLYPIISEALGWKEKPHDS